MRILNNSIYHIGNGVFENGNDFTNLNTPSIPCKLSMIICI